MAAIMKPEAQKVDGNTGQIVEVHPSTEEVVFKVKEFLESKEKKVFFNGKRYAEYDDFQYIGTFYGITVKTFDPHFVEIGGRKGFHAKAMLLREQLEVGRAEAFCMDDEPNWRNKPLFQLASMAQTRAAAKAYSNLFRPIVRMAGIEGTPAEEMESDAPALALRSQDDRVKALGERIINPPKEDEFGPLPQDIDNAEEIMSDETAARPVPDELQDYNSIPAPTSGRSVKRISEKQRKFLWAKCKSANVPEPSIKAFIKQHWNVTSTSDLPWQAMDPLLKWIDSFASLGHK